jgi:hypothetical protein
MRTIQRRRPRYQTGNLVERSGSFYVRYYTCMKLANQNAESSFSAGRTIDAINLSASFNPRLVW